MSIIRRQLKKFTCICFSLIMAFSLAQPVCAKEKDSLLEEKIAELVELDKKEDFSKYGIDIPFIAKMLEVSEYLDFADDGKTVVLSLSDKELDEDYGFTQKQIDDFHAVLNGTYQGPEATESIPIPPMTRAETRLYISYYDLTTGIYTVLYTAALAGPAALAVAWTGLTTAGGGLAGTAFGIATSILGIAFFADLASKIIVAVGSQKGIALYLETAIPPIRVEVE